MFEITDVSDEVVVDYLIKHGLPRELSVGKFTEFLAHIRSLVHQGYHVWKIWF